MKIFIFTFFICSSFAFSKVELTSWSSKEGVKRFERSKAKKDFFTLSNNFIGQPNKIACGPTTGAIVLNALRLRKESSRELPKTHFHKKLKKHISKKWDPRFKRYTPWNFFNEKNSLIKSREQVYGEPVKGKKDFGFQLRQLHQMFLSHDVNSEIRIIDKKMTLKKMKKDFIKNLKEKDNYIVVNYSRKSLEQKGGGHISPIGAYDKNSDSFLILDVNPNKAEWVWVESTDLFSSMKTFDTVENRGYLLISKK